MTDKQERTDGYVQHREGKQYLPPIQRIKMPDVRVLTTKIRWLYALGYEIKDISNGLGVRYQQVRNMALSQPKRASREDIPELKIELLDFGDEVEMLLDAELDRTFLEDRQAKKGKGKGRGRPKKDGKPTGMAPIYDEEDLDEVDEITEIGEEEI